MTLGAVRGWRRRHPVLVEILISVALGILIEIALQLFHPPTLLLVRRVGDDTADRMIRLAERTTGRIAVSPAYTFVDIDDATWGAWGQPLVTPRDRIAALVERLARSQPLAIILDIDLAFPGEGDGERRLQQVLADYDAAAPPLFLVRSLIAIGSDAPMPAERRTAYDLATNGKANIVWASPLFERDADSRIRRWRLFADACDDGRPSVLASTHLAAAFVARQAVYGPPPGDASPPLERLRKAIAAFVPDNCQRAGPERAGVIDGWPEEIPIRIDGEDVSRRVIYRVGWQDGAIGLGPLVQGPDGLTQLVAVRPAGTVLAADASAALPGIAGRIVVVGGSFADSGDWHATPLGRMPGALLIINAVEALTLNGTPRELGTVERFSISLGIIVLASLLTAFFRPSVAAAGFAFGIFVLMVISIGRFKSGVMLDLAVPAVGALLHDLAETAISTYHALRRQGWRWILKAPRPPEPPEGSKEGHLS